jgi:hypothetical protein
LLQEGHQFTQAATAEASGAETADDGAAAQHQSRGDAEPAEACRRQGCDRDQAIATDLLEIIAVDQLYDAVLDNRQPETEPA